MNDTQKAKITRFLDDQVMSASVYEVLHKTFAGPIGKANDIHVLAAERLAISMLDMAWKELEKHRRSEHDANDRANPAV